MGSTVILGLGNPLLSDEGLGVHLIHVLEQAQLPDTVQVIDGGTAGLLLLSIVEEAKRLLILDAIDAAKPPGTLMHLQDLPKYGKAKLSPHQLSFQEVLAFAAMQGNLPAEIALIGAQPHSLEWGCELSPLIKSEIPALLGMVSQQLHDWGIPNKIEATFNTSLWYAPAVSVLH